MAARSELNGAVGRLLAFDIERGRFTLAIGSDAIRVRPQNLLSKKHEHIVLDAAAPPFLVVRPRGGGLAVPPGGGEVLDQAFALRFCLSQIAPTSTCPVCLEEIPTNEIDDRGAMGVINMFPCGHTLCRPCTARLFQPRVPGVTCPTCRQSWSTGSAASGGGSILCEIPT